MKVLTGKGSLINFTSDAPVRRLEEANGKFIAGTVLEILTNETLCESIIDSMLTALKGDIDTELEKYANAHKDTALRLNILMRSSAKQVLFSMMFAYGK